MRAAVKRFTAVILFMIMITSCFMSVNVFADDENETENGNMNLDLVFVLDASGSMVYSDPDKIALDAFSLFVDLCDDTCAVGYDVYTHELKDSEEIKSISDNESLENMKKKIRGIKYDSNGDTDIALGLTEAKHIFENHKSESYRKKAIILLSDGNTDLPKGPRTVAESVSEMESTLNSFAENNIQVYTIGLNSNGSLDKNDLESISKKTGGKSYEIDVSEKLTNIISDIFGSISDMNGIDREIKDGTVEININDSSVFYVNIIIRTKLSLDELSPMLILPSGSPMSLTDNEKVKITSTKSYVLIKILYPDVGNYTLHLKKADNTNCNVKQLNFYSVFITQRVPEKAAVNTAVEIESTISDNNGLMKDNEILSTLKMKAVISFDGSSTAVELHRVSPGVYKGSFTPNKTGAYSVVTIGESERFNKESDKTSIIVKTSLNDGSELIEDILSFVWHHLTIIIMAGFALGVIIVASVMIRKK